MANVEPPEARSKEPPIPTRLLRHPGWAWEAHAAGCAVCGTEAAQVRTRLDAGVAIADIRSSIIKAFGPPLDAHMATVFFHRS